MARTPEVFVSLVAVPSKVGETSSRDLISTGDQNLSIEVQRESRHSVGVTTSDYTVTSTGLGMADIVTDALSGPGLVLLHLISRLLTATFPP